MLDIIFYKNHIKNTMCVIISLQTISNTSKTTLNILKTYIKYIMPAIIFTKPTQLQYKN